MIVIYHFEAKNSKKNFGPNATSRECTTIINTKNYLLGANSLVATDATCFMAWIVAQYGLKLPKNYKMKDRCFKGVGDKADINQKSCS